MHARLVCKKYPGAPPPPGPASLGGALSEKRHFPRGLEVRRAVSSHVRRRRPGIPRSLREGFSPRPPRARRAARAGGTRRRRPGALRPLLPPQVCHRWAIRTVIWISLSRRLGHGGALRSAARRRGPFGVRCRPRRRRRWRRRRQPVRQRNLHRLYGLARQLYRPIQHPGPGWCRAILVGRRRRWRVRPTGRKWRRGCLCDGRPPRVRRAAGDRPPRHRRRGRRELLLRRLYRDQDGLWLLRGLLPRRRHRRRRQGDLGGRRPVRSPTLECDHGVVGGGGHRGRRRRRGSAPFWRCRRLRAGRSR
jgi:hypothetical protein